jgi:hypothetical protein
VSASGDLIASFAARRPGSAKRLIAVDAKDGLSCRQTGSLGQHLRPARSVAGADRARQRLRGGGGKSVEDIKESNWGSWRHTITHYFAGTQLRAQLAKAVGIG